MAADLKGVGTGAQVVGLAAKGAGLAGFGAGTAAAAAIPVIGWAAGAVSLAASLFGRKSEGYAQTVGFEIKGQASKDGIFAGAVTGLSSNGTSNYRISEAEGAYGERAVLNRQVSEWWQKYFPDNPDLTIPIDITLGPDWYGSVTPGLDSFFKNVADQRNSYLDNLAREEQASSDANALLDQLTSAASSLTAPTIATGETPTMEAPTLTSNMPAPVMPSSTAPAATVAAAAGAPGNTRAVANPMLALVPLAIIAFFLLKG